MKTALVVENHPVFITFLKSLLTREGLQVRTADDGLAALQLLKQDVPDIIFTDLIMPNVGGDRLCQLIRRIPKYQSIYLVLVSGLAPELDLPRWPPYGADAVIAKCPFERMIPYVMGVLAQLERPPDLRDTDLVFGLDTAFPRQVSQELLAGKLHNEQLLACISEGICELTLEGTIIYLNPVALSLFDRPLEHLISANIVDLFENSEREAMQGFLSQARFIQDTIQPKFTFRLGPRDVELDIVPQTDTDETKIFIILHDVTQKRRNEKRLQKAHKMEAVGTLAAGIAHDFNNLMMAIQGNVSLLMLDTASNKLHHPRLKTIEEHIENASNVTRNLLGYARMGRYQVQQLELNHLIEDTIATFGRARRDIEINCHLTPASTCVEADSGQLRQALFNLLVAEGNTMPQGGTITLHTSRISRKELPKLIPDSAPGEYIYLHMTDRGPGMEAGVRDRIFEPFSDLGETPSEDSLSLAAAHGCVRGHGGYIDIQSGPGEGTSFRLFLPAVSKTAPKGKPEQQQLEAPALDDSAAASEGTRILLIDDESAILKVGQAMLESLGYQVTTASNGKSAQDALERQCDDIGLVLMDMTLPDISGNRLYPRLKSIDPQVKVIVISGYALDEKVGKLLSDGCRGFIQKPFTLKTLAAEIKVVLD